MLVNLVIIRGVFYVCPSFRKKESSLTSPPRLQPNYHATQVGPGTAELERLGIPGRTLTLNFLSEYHQKILVLIL